MKILSLSLLVVLLLSGCSLLPTRVIYQDLKLSECVQAGGKYRIDKGYYDDEYYAECKIPEKTLWKIKVSTQLLTK